RIIGQGRWQHPFHEHGNHVRVLARDGNLILGNASLNYPAGGTATVSAPALAGPLLFTTTTTPGLAMDGIFYWSGRGLNCGAAGTGAPSRTIASAPTGEAGFAVMWHSHNEREITTNNICPGGMLMMMLVDSREFVIDESN